ncbi:DUF1178 family protein [Asticcacaulis benevestitus]|uniref:Uncharacterized protein n=1 Tax=Asticcacaulis benevestitus DSM 16100 = ATCC BAA-896 TaxID=1121022 RepID=V4RR55_9CAUL|nr:DUF1178 family protein [Asticcacaulis benevestitus]ESQ93658.1 hypothetical protein ABENE_04900 [Asticcacaulis benevestitus DSM 16100 = ATCC BAA-896]
MIRYALKCIVEHEFEAWFSSSNGFDEQVAQGLVECPMCGSKAVTKAIMAPMVRTTKGKDAPGSLAEAQQAVAEALHRLRRHVETTHDYVGDGFADEARDIHQGMAPDRPIYGEATPDEVRGLVEDGVPVAALPVFKPKVEEAKVQPVVPVIPPAIDKKLN